MLRHKSFLHGLLSRVLPMPGLPMNRRIGLTGLTNDNVARITHLMRERRRRIELRSVWNFFLSSKIACWTSASSSIPLISCDRKLSHCLILALAALCSSSRNAWMAEVGFLKLCRITDNGWVPSDTYGLQSVWVHLSTPGTFFSILARPARWPSRDRNRRRRPRSRRPCRCPHSDC